MIFFKCLKCIGCNPSSREYTFKIININILIFNHKHFRHIHTAKTCVEYRHRFVFFKFRLHLNVYTLNLYNVVGGLSESEECRVLNFVRYAQLSYEQFRKASLFQRNMHPTHFQEGYKKELVCRNTD